MNSAEDFDGWSAINGVVFGHILRNLRQARGWSQGELARIANAALQQAWTAEPPITPAWVSGTERGEVAVIRQPYIVAFALAFDMPVSRLLATEFGSAPPS